MSQVIARKYRPQTFAEVLGQETVITTLKNSIKHKRVAHAYLFSGSRGTGKTTLARILAKALNCQNSINEEPCNQCASCQEITAGHSLDVLEIDGASNRGIEDIRQINETVSYASSNKHKIYLIDEVHMLTKEAFNALLKTLEEPPSHVIFLFATTEPHKVLPTILSRCQRFQLNRIPLNTIIEKLLTITKDLKVEAEPKALHLIATRSEGGLRDAESLLDQMISFNGGKLTEESVAKSLGLLPKNLFFELDFAGKEGNLAKAFEISEAIFSEGKDFIYFVESYAEHFRILLEIKLSEGIPEHLSLLKEEHKRYLESAALYSKETLLYILESVVNGMIEIRSAPNSRIYLEQLLLKTLRSHQRVPVETILKRLSELEDLLSEWGNKTESAPFEKVSQGARSSSLEKGPEMTPQGARSSSLEKGPEATPQGARSSSLEKSPEVTPQGARSSSLEKGPEVTPQGARSSSLEKGHEVTPQGARSSSLEKGPEATSQKGVFADPPPFQKKTSPTQDKGVPFLATPEKKKQETEQNTNLPFTKRTTKKETIQESQSNPFIQRPSFTKEQESRFDTLLQFSAVELEGKVEKHP